MDRLVQDHRVVPEDRLRARCRGASQSRTTTRSRRGDRSRRDGDVVDEAEAHGPRGSRVMVARWARRRDEGRRLAVAQGLDGRQPQPGTSDAVSTRSTWACRGRGRPIRGGQLRQDLQVHRRARARLGEPAGLPGSGSRPVDAGARCPWATASRRVGRSRCHPAGVLEIDAEHGPHEHAPAHRQGSVAAERPAARPRPRRPRPRRPPRSRRAEPGTPWRRPRCTGTPGCTSGCLATEGVPTGVVERVGEDHQSTPATSRRTSPASAGRRSFRPGPGHSSTSRPRCSVSLGGVPQAAGPLDPDLRPSVPSTPSRHDRRSAEQARTNVQYAWAGRCGRARRGRASVGCWSGRPPRGSRRRRRPPLRRRIEQVRADHPRQLRSTVMASSPFPSGSSS